MTMPTAWWFYTHTWAKSVTLRVHLKCMAVKKFDLHQHWLFRSALQFCRSALKCADLQCRSAPYHADLQCRSAVLMCRSAPYHADLQCRSGADLVQICTPMQICTADLVQIWCRSAPHYADLVQIWCRSAPPLCRSGADLVQICTKGCRSALQIWCRSGADLHPSFEIKGTVRER